MTAKNNAFVFSRTVRLEGVSSLQATMSEFSYSRHAHEEYSFGAPVAGQQNFFCNSKYHSCKPGDVIIFNPDDVHDGERGSAQPLEYSMLYVDVESMTPWLRHHGMEPNTIGRFTDNSLSAPFISRQIVALSQMVRNDLGNRIELESGLGELARSLCAFFGHDFAMPRRKRRNAIMRRCKEFILEYCSEDISVEDISAVSCMSKYHFIREFRAEFGVTPYQYVINCRLNLAKRDLSLGANIQDVIAHYQFSDLSHFNRRFKKSFGVTPRQYQFILNK